MNEAELEQMRQWVHLPADQVGNNNNKLDIQGMLRETREANDMEQVQDEFTTNKYVVVNEIAAHEHMALVCNVYMHATTGKKFYKWWIWTLIAIRYKCTWANSKKVNL